MEALVMEKLYQTSDTVWKLTDAQIVCGTMGLPTATVKMLGPDGLEHIKSVVGTGPVDACYKAVDGIVNLPVSLLDYGVSAVTEGIDALAVTKVSVEPTGDKLEFESANGLNRRRVFSGQGSDTDIVVSSTRAYVSALNKLLAHLRTLSTVKKQTTE